MEAVALILLSGAQVIGELERKTDALTEEKLSGFETRRSRASATERGRFMAKEIIP